MASKRGGRKLSPEAVGFVIEAILAGRSNRQINAALVTRGYLPEGDQLSKQALWRYRKDKRVQEAIAKAFEERLQIAHRHLSRRIVRAVEINRATAERLLDDTGGHLRALDPAELTMLVRTFIQTGRIIASVTSDVWQREDEQARAAAAAAEERKRVNDALMEHLREIGRKVQGNAPG